MPRNNGRRYSAWPVSEPPLSPVPDTAMLPAGPRPVPPFITQRYRRPNARRRFQFLTPLCRRLRANRDLWFLTPSYSLPNDTSRQCPIAGRSKRRFPLSICRSNLCRASEIHRGKVRWDVALSASFADSNKYHFHQERPQDDHPAWEFETPRVEAPLVPSTDAAMPGCCKPVIVH